MAVVVDARSAGEAQAGLPAGLGTVGPARVPRTRQALVMRWLTLVAAAAYAVALVADSAARSTLPSGAIADAIHAFDAGAGLLCAGVCVTGWLTRRDDTGLLLAVTLATVLVAVRGTANGLLLALELSTFADLADAGLGLLVLGCLVWAATSLMAWRPTSEASVAGRVSTGSARAGQVPVAGRASAGHASASRLADAGAEMFRRVVEVAALLVFAASLTGVTVRAVGASWACSGTFPDCNGLGMLPFGRDPLADIQLYHRLLAYVALALVAWVAVEAYRSQRHLAGTAIGLFGATLLQGAIGAASVALANPPLSQVLHMAGAAASWSAAVVLVALAHRAPVLDRTQEARPGGAAENLVDMKCDSRTPGPSLSNEARPTATWTENRLVGRASSGDHKLALGRTLSAYVQLTKPRVMSLLLATTAAAMVIAARGMPELGVFLATLLGGALMSGGAGAINHYVDRDIDPLMGRTAWRPIPSGVISPRKALTFGIALAFMASAVFIAFVNPLACLLALLGLLGYVFIYTLWLKRSTPSNIVIGGAAGAIPPLVGWAAVTNEIGSLTAWYLFAIIFFWTPPHFWALSLLIRKHYERAGIPMLPVVRGEDETRRQIVLYSILLVVLTLVLSPFGMMGGIYFAAAIVLGGLFIRDALGLWRQGTPQAARRLYLYSILYLFALFAAMAVDRVLTTTSSQ